MDILLLWPDIQLQPPGTESKQGDTLLVLLCTEWAQADILTQQAGIWSPRSGTLFLTGHILFLLRDTWSARVDSGFLLPDIVSCGSMLLGTVSARADKVLSRPDILSLRLDTQYLLPGNGFAEVDTLFPRPDIVFPHGDTVLVQGCIE